jgi:hypothetical protein
MKIIHKLDGTQVKYGYIWWTADRDREFEKLFPKTEFIIELEGNTIRRRKVDWKRRRVYIGKELINGFKVNEVIEIFKETINPEIIKIRKKLKE